MLNEQPLNSGPLNALGGSGVQEIQPGAGFAWDVRVTLAGVDVSDSLTGLIRIERPEDGDSVASFALWLGPEPVNVAAYTGQPVVIDFVVDGSVTDRRFTGYLVQPEFDVLTRVLTCDATTRLQDGIEAMELDAIDQFVGGLWSPDVFGDVAGRSRWDYAQERLSTRRASLNVTRYGQPRITSWYPALAFEFGPGSTVYESVDIGLAALSETTNVIELELDYRYTRYRQRNTPYTWAHPAGSFAAWRADSTELPDVQMITDAVESAGWYVSSATWQRLPGDLPTLPQPWYNKNTDLLLGASFTASIRWTQRAVEQYRIRLEIPQSVAAVGEVIRRERVVLDTDTDADRLWEQSREAVDFLDDYLPQRDPNRLASAMGVALARGQAQLAAANRRNLVSWQVPMAHALGVDLGQRLRLHDQGADITGTLVTLVDELDTLSGAALLTVVVAVSQGPEGQVSDPLVVPAPPVFVDGPGSSVTSALPTQLIKDPSSPPYDEELPGFAGAYSVGTWDPELRYPRRFAVPTPQIPEHWRNEAQAERTATYAVAPPRDTLEI